MLHRVSDWEDNKLFSNENMKVSPTSLDKFLSIIKKKYNIIKSEDIIKYTSCKHDKPFIVFTMDDGYKDNYSKALPIFKKHNIPFTIFLASNFPQNTAVLWWYELEDLIINNQIITLSNGKIYSCKTKEEKEKSFLDIRLEILKLNQTNIIKELNSLFNNYKIDWSIKCKELCLSWENIKELKNESLVTIGAHTLHHYNLKALNSKEEIKVEIEKGLKLLQDKASLSTKIFAYPYGSSNEVGDREIETIKSMNFDFAFLSYGGNINKKNIKNIYYLPRNMLTEEIIKYEINNG